MAKDYQSVQTPEFRLCFPNLFKPTSFEGSTRETYNCVMVFPKDADLSKLKELAKAAFQKAFPNGAKGARSPFRDGNEKVEDWGEAFRDTTFIRVSSNLKPPVADRKKHLIADEEQVYSGCYARAVVHAFAYDVKGNRGISFGLDAVQILRDGERLGGGGLAAVNTFDDLDDDDWDDDTPATTSNESADDMFA